MYTKFLATVLENRGNYFFRRPITQCIDQLYGVWRSTQESWNLGPWPKDWMHKPCDEFSICQNNDRKWFAGILSTGTIWVWTLLSFTILGWGEGGVSKALFKSFKQLHNQNMSLTDRHFLDQILYGTAYEWGQGNSTNIPKILTMFMSMTSDVNWKENSETGTAITINVFWDTMLRSQVLSLCVMVYNTYKKSIIQCKIQNDLPELEKYLGDIPLINGSCFGQ